VAAAVIGLITAFGCTSTTDSPDSSPASTSAVAGNATESAIRAALRANPQWTGAARSAVDTALMSSALGLVNDACRSVRSVRGARSLVDAAEADFLSEPAAERLPDSETLAEVWAAIVLDFGTGAECPKVQRYFTDLLSTGPLAPHD
jgi:hypothetical protein